MPSLFRFETFIGLRYTASRKAGGGNRFISFISLISMLGLALGVAALIVVVSVMNGFQKELRTRTPVSSRLRPTCSSRRCFPSTVR